MKSLKKIIIYFIFLIIIKNIYSDNNINQIISNLISDIEKDKNKNQFIEEKDEKYCPIIFAVSKGKNKTLKKLLENPKITPENATLDINAQNKHGQTAIIYSIASSNINDYDIFKAIEKLLKPEKVTIEPQSAPPPPPPPPPTQESTTSQTTTGPEITSSTETLLSQIGKMELKKTKKDVKRPEQSLESSDIFLEEIKRGVTLKKVPKEQKTEKITPLNVPEELENKLLNFPQKIKENKNKNNTKELNKNALETINKQIDETELNEKNKNQLKKILEYYIQQNEKNLNNLLKELLLDKIIEKENIPPADSWLIEIQIANPKKIDNEERINNLINSIDELITEYDKFFDKTIKKYLKIYKNNFSKKQKTRKKEKIAKAEGEEEKEKAKKEFEERTGKINFNWEKENKNMHKIFQNINDSLNLNIRKNFLKKEDISNLKNKIGDLLENENFKNKYKKIFNKKYKRENLFNLLKNLDFTKAEITSEKIKNDFPDEK